MCVCLFVLGAYMHFAFHISEQYFTVDLKGLRFAYEHALVTIDKTKINMDVIIRNRRSFIVTLESPSKVSVMLSLYLNALHPALIPALVS